MQQAVFTRSLCGWAVKTLDLEWVWGTRPTVLAWPQNFSWISHGGKTSQLGQWNIQTKVTQIWIHCTGVLFHFVCVGVGGCTGVEFVLLGVKVLLTLILVFLVVVIEIIICSLVSNLCPLVDYFKLCLCVSAAPTFSSTMCMCERLEVMFCWWWYELQVLYFVEPCCWVTAVRMSFAWPVNWSCLLVIWIAGAVFCWAAASCVAESQLSEWVLPGLWAGLSLPHAGHQERRSLSGMG